jgi:hypothetical protein
MQRHSHWPPGRRSLPAQGASSCAHCTLHTRLRPRPNGLRSGAQPDWMPTLSAIQRAGLNQDASPTHQLIRYRAFTNRNFARLASPSKSARPAAAGAKIRLSPGFRRNVPQARSDLRDQRSLSLTQQTHAMLSCSSTPSRSPALHYPTARLYQSGRWMLIVLGPMGGCNRCSRVSLRLLLSHQVRKEAGGKKIRGKCKKKKLPGLVFHPYVHTHSSEDAHMHVHMYVYVHVYMCTYM